MGSFRILLAVSVMFAHTGGLARYNLAGGQAAVQAFYILSGIYMAMVLERRYSPYRDISRFYASRALRIYPVYVTAVFLALALGLVVHFISGGGWLHRITIAWETLSAFDRAWLAISSLFLFGADVLNFTHLDNGTIAVGSPALDRRVWDLLPIPVSWSIAIELSFYLLVPFLVRLEVKHLLLLFILSVNVRIVLTFFGLVNDPWSYRFFPSEIALFVLGIVSWRVRERSFWGALPTYTPLMLIPIVLLVQPVAVVASKLGLPREIVGCSFYLCIAVFGPHLFELTKRNRVDALFGRLSFSAYLVHWPIVGFFDAMVDANLALPSLRTVVCSLAALFVATLIAFFVERPLDNLRHELLTKNANRLRSGGSQSMPQPG